jgi:hypothetical protein
MKRQESLSLGGAAAYAGDARWSYPQLLDSGIKLDAIGADYMAEVTLGILLMAKLRSLQALKKQKLGSEEVDQAIQRGDSRISGW